MATHLGGVATPLASPWQMPRPARPIFAHLEDDDEDAATVAALVAVGALCMLRYGTTSGEDDERGTLCIVSYEEQ
jgi:hypothetical protein